MIPIICSSPLRLQNGYRGPRNVGHPSNACNHTLCMKETYILGKQNVYGCIDVHTHTVRQLRYNRVNGTCGARTVVEKPRRAEERIIIMIHVLIAQRDYANAKRFLDPARRVRDEYVGAV